MSGTTKEVTAEVKAQRLAAVDKALQAAKAGLAGKQPGTNADATKAEKAPKEKKEKPEKPAKVEKAPKEKKEKPEKPARGPAHLAKVEAASASLPSLSKEAALVSTRIIADETLTAADLNGIAQHLQHRARCLQTAKAASTEARLEIGATVKIVSASDKGAQKFIGSTGTLAKVRNIRCFVDVRDAAGKIVKRELYLFKSDVEVIACAPAPSAEKTEAKPSELELTNGNEGPVNAAAIPDKAEQVPTEVGDESISDPESVEIESGESEPIAA
jgi:hypothetical protein